MKYDIDTTIYNVEYDNYEKCFFRLLGWKLADITNRKLKPYLSISYHIIHHMYITYLPVHVYHVHAHYSCQSWIQFERDGCIWNVVS